MHRKLSNIFLYLSVVFDCFINHSILFLNLLSSRRYSFSCSEWRKWLSNVYSCSFRGRNFWLNTKPDLSRHRRTYRSCYLHKSNCHISGYIERYNHNQDEAKNLRERCAISHFSPGLVLAVQLPRKNRRLDGRSFLHSLRCVSNYCAAELLCWRL